MITYAETKHNKEFDWYKALRKATKGQLDHFEINDLKKLASNWITCACGNLCAAIPRNIQGEPIDDDLQILGSAFYNKVNAELWDDAIEVLHEIEARSIQIMSEMNQS